MTDGYLVDKFLDKTFLYSNRQNTDRLVKYIKEKKCAFILGAGVGFPTGFPLWNGLLNELFLETVPVMSSVDTKLRKDVFDYLKSIRGSAIMQSINPLEQGEYLSILLENFHQNNIREVLEKHDERRNARFLVATVSEALKAYCLKNKKKREKKSNWRLMESLASFIRDGDVLQIINYNFDDLLEYTLIKCMRMEPDSDFKSVGLDECVYDNSSGRPMIYHVHGRVPVLLEGKDEYYKSGLIFDERSYMNMELSIYNNSNICQSQVLRSHHALFMGVSLQDASMRRIIFKGMNLPDEVNDIINKQIGKREFCLPDDFNSDSFNEHYFLFPIDSLLGELKIKHELPEEKQVASIGVFLRLHTMYLMIRGVFPIYCTYDDLPAILENVKESVSQFRDV